MLTFLQRISITSGVRTVGSNFVVAAAQCRGGCVRGEPLGFIVDVKNKTNNPISKTFIWLEQVKPFTPAFPVHFLFCPHSNSKNLEKYFRRFLKKKPRMAQPSTPDE